MGRRVVAIECNYKELGRQLKEQFMHGLNNSVKVVDVIRELNKTDENTLVTSEKVLVCAKGIAVQRSETRGTISEMCAGVQEAVQSTKYSRKMTRNMKITLKQ